MDCPLAIEDVFAAGIGCDIAGAWLLSRGLIASLVQVHVAGATTMGGNPEAWARGVRDRVDATFGLFWLGMGFVIQVVGYALILGTEPSVSGSIRRALVAVAFAMLAGMVVMVLDLATHRWRLRHAAVALARIARVAQPEGGDRYETRPLPSGQMLRELGKRLLDEQPRDGEPDNAYARRVWKVDRISDHSAY